LTDIKLPPEILTSGRKKQEKIEQTTKESSGIKVFSNYVELPYEPNKRPVFMPKTMGELVCDFQENFPGMVRYNHKLCDIVEDTERPGWRSMRFLEDGKQLESAINDRGYFVDFKNRDMNLKVKWEPFFYSIRNRAKTVRTVTDLPTWPEGPGQIHCSPPIVPAYTGALDAFIDFFNPLTPHDRLIMKAIVITAAWSEGQGKRPLFVIAGPPDADQTIQIGKSTFVEMVQELFYSPCDLNVCDEPSRFIINLMANTHRRIFRLDNVKKMFNSDIIERYVTSKYLQGHVHGVGNRMVENHATWILTANNPHLTVDLGSRSVTGRMDFIRPGTTWYKHNVLSFIDTMRMPVVAECAYYLTMPMIHLDRPCVTRFPEWERTILHKLGEDVGAGIKLDQARLVDRTEEHAAFRDFIYSRIISYKVPQAYKRDIEQTIENGRDDFILSPEKFNILITTQIVSDWYFDFHGLRYKSNRGGGTGRAIKKQAIEAGLIAFDGKKRIGCLSLRVFWFANPIADQPTYAILQKRSEDAYATLVKD
jgi:hypothetical protein